MESDPIDFADRPSLDLHEPNIFSKLVLRFDAYIDEKYQYKVIYLAMVLGVFSSLLLLWLALSGWVSNSSSSFIQALGFGYIYIHGLQSCFNEEKFFFSGAFSIANLVIYVFNLS
ncbi:MAG: hypothetical protein ACKE5M_00820 [Methylophilaceae bacterium]